MHRSILPVLLTLVPLTSAADNWTAGNVTAHPPFQLSTSAFVEALGSAKIGRGSFIPGYDVSLPPSNITPPQANLSGLNNHWVLNIDLTPDVPLKSSLSNTVDKSKFTQLTTIGLQALPNDTWNDAGWRVCATVFVGGVGAKAPKGFNPSPSCRGALSDECLAGLKAFAGSNGLDSEGRCRGMGLPTGCGDDLGSGGAQIWTEINSTILPMGKFFAYGTEPTTKGDNVSIANAADWVWPVVLNWAHLAENGEVQSSEAFVSCMSNTGYRYSTSAGVSSREQGSRLGMWLALGAAVLGAGFMA